MTETDDLERLDRFAKIRIIGVGGGGCNAVTRINNAGLKGADMVVINTDAQALVTSSVKHKIQIAPRLTRGLGFGAKPELGEKAMEESRHEIIPLIDGMDMVFITAGMGGGTGTGFAPLIAKLAKEMGVLTVGVVTKPFGFEGKVRMSNAEAGIVEMEKYADSIIIISNERLLDTVTTNPTLIGAFQMVDDSLRQAIGGLSSLITKVGMINLDFADIATILRGGGRSVIGMGKAIGAGADAKAAEEAITSPLIDYPIEGAGALIINVSGGEDLSLGQVNQAVERVKASAWDGANIIFGAAIDETMRKGTVAVTVVLSQFGEHIAA